MKALYKYAPGPGNLELTERPVPVLNERDNVLVHISACAVCGMDHRIYHGTYPCSPPFIMGHEMVGRVVQTLGNADGLTPDTRVTLAPHLYSCGHCAACKAGLPQFCAQKRTVGIDRDGAMAAFAALPVAHLHPVPEEIPDKLACIIEPFSMIYGNIVPEIRREKAQSVLIIGAGQVGMMALASAKSVGVPTVLMSGITKDKNYRFPVARQLGASKTIDSLTEPLEKTVLELTGNVGVDIVLEASGSQAGISQAVSCLRKGGVLIAMGMTRKEQISVPWDACLKKAIRIHFHMQSSYQYMDEVIRMFTRPYTNLSPLISREAPLSQWQKLFEYMDTHDTLKNVLYIDC